MMEILIYYYELFLGAWSRWRVAGAEEGAEWCPDWSPRLESNQYPTLRRHVHYPLCYGELAGPKAAQRIIATFGVERLAQHAGGVHALVKLAQRYPCDQVVKFAAGGVGRAGRCAGDEVVAG